MTKIFILVLFFIFFFLFPANAQQGENDYVILLHGLARSKHSMEKLEKRLKNEGYRVLNLDYPSREETIEQIVQNTLIPEIRRFCTDSTKKIYFVTHSMGGIVLRYYLNLKPHIKTGRIVMLSPPNKGSEVVDFLKNIPGIKKLMGPAFSQLSADSVSFVNSLKPVKEEIGVITGSSSINFINSIIIPGADDGKVSVQRARLDEMTDFLIVERSHPFIMNAPEVSTQILYFLKNGIFKKSNKDN